MMRRGWMMGFGAAILCATLAPAQTNLTLKGGQGPGQGKHIVLVSGDEEYRSEQALVQMARILATRHGFDCTVLFAIDPATGAIDPTVRDNIPGLESLDDADLLVLFTRFRDLPADQMQHIVDYVKAGRPIVAMRTATHAFDIAEGKPFADWGWKSKSWDGGFGRQVLGETWVAHHGNHAKESTRGIIAPGMADHPILRGIESGDIWGPSDVYKVTIPLPGDSQPLVLGQVLTGMNPEDPPVEGEKNDPMMPVAWVKSYQIPGGKPGKVFTTTMGSANDLPSAGLRRLLVNACYWAVGLDAAIPAESDVAIVGTYEPLPFKFGGHQPGVKPADLKP